MSEEQKPEQKPFAFNFAKKDDGEDSDGEGMTIDFDELKKKKLEEKLSSLSGPALEAAKKLQELQAERSALYLKFVDERRDLERKYEQLYAPIYDQRAAAAGADEPVIPKFWLEALKNHPNIGTVVEEQDEDALASLKDIKCVTHDDGYELVFTFRPNEYFTNTVWPVEIDSRY